jgi:hypothetical protein
MASASARKPVKSARPRNPPGLFHQPHGAVTTIAGECTRYNANDHSPSSMNGVAPSHQPPGFRSMAALPDSSMAKNGSSSKAT